MLTRLLSIIIRFSPIVLLAIIMLVFGLLSNEFLSISNLTNIVIQSCPTAIAATGMTIVLLTAGVDLSVGSIMFLSVAVAGKMIFADQPLWLAHITAISLGCVAGALNAFFITKARIVSFIVTLATLYVTRGLGLWITNTRAMNMPAEVTDLGTSRGIGIPLPVIIMASVMLVSHMVLTKTAWGRQIYAIGYSASDARKAGVRVDAILFMVYVVSGALAAIGGLVALAQTGAVSPSFGQGKEFAAIAAAVLGGTSLFGGRGAVLPGTLLGTLLFQTVENGLVLTNTDPYVYPMVISSVIFLAVLIDTTKARWTGNGS